MHNMVNILETTESQTQKHDFLVCEYFNLKRKNTFKRKLCITTINGKPVIFQIHVKYINITI